MHHRIVAAEKGAVAVDAATAVILEMIASEDDFVIRPLTDLAEAVGGRVVDEEKFAEPGEIQGFRNAANDLFAAGPALQIGRAHV